MNELEKVLSQNDNEVLSVYLEEVSCDDFRKHIEEITSNRADKGAIKQAIEYLQKLL